MVFIYLITGCNTFDDIVSDIEQNFNYHEIYSDNPNGENCYEGIINQQTRDEVIQYINYVRDLHYLPPVLYAEEDEILAQKASLISYANGFLTHHPNNSLNCYSELGDIGCGKSNLHISYRNSDSNIPNSEFIQHWMHELYSESIGHRRWILFPFLKSVAFGRVDGPSMVGDYNFISAASLKVINDQFADISQIEVEYIAYPYQDYPIELFPLNARLNFSVLANRNNNYANSVVDFSDATIIVTNPQGMNMQINDILYDNIFYGLPNSLEWRVENLQQNVNYTVNIQNVKIENEIKNYNYNFKIQ